MKYDFKDRVVLLTGGGSGIGRETAFQFAKSGAKVVIAGYREESINRTFAELQKISGDSHAIIADVTKIDDCFRAVKETIGKFGKIDILINNAGYALKNDAGLPPKSVEISEENYDYLLDINLKGPFFMIQAAAPYMIEKKYGRIVNLGSTTGIRGHHGTTPYCAAKAGLMTMTMVMAREFGQHNITVNCVAPGLVITEMQANTPKELLEKQAAQIALGRAGQPADVAHVIMFFSTEELFATGQTLVVDGGNTMR